jgi:hypothetical protein
MAAIVFDPFRAQARLAWHNRFARWRRDGAQSAFHAGALAALALLLAVPAWQSRAAWGASLAVLLHQWPMTVLLLATLAMTWRQAAVLGALRRQAAQDWLAALPVPAALHRRRRRDAMLREAAGHALVAALLLSGARAAPALVVVFALSMAGSLLLAVPVARVAAHPRRARLAFGSPIADHGAGRLWRWQRIACGVALRGRTLSLGAFALLAPPMDSGIAVAAIVAIAGLSFALLSGAWRRSLAVLPQAQAWLAAQPLAPGRLLRATWAVPAFVLASATVAIAGVLAALGAWRLAGAVALALAGFGGLHYAATAAERARPRRAVLAFLLHAMLLLATLQSFPPAVLPLWMVQMAWLLRRALR